jgi:predicted phosphoribosyltransferase
MFRNREDAAFRLAARLRSRAFYDPLVLAVPRGGVLVGAVLAEELDADLDVILARKLRWPGNPERALGAVSEAGTVYLNPEGQAREARLRGYLDTERQNQLREIVRCRQLYRGGRPAATVRGRSVIVTDDGVATGATLAAAVWAVRGQLPVELVVAVPVGSPQALRELGRWGDEIVCPLQPDDLQAVSQYYEDFGQVEDEQVVDLLRTFAVARHHSHEGP